MNDLQTSHDLNEPSLPPEETRDVPEPAHEPKGKWTCIKCGSVNSPSLKTVLVKTEEDQDGTEEDMLVPAEQCWNCEEPRHLTLEQLGVSHRTIQALAGGLVDQAQNAAGVEQVERGDASVDAKPNGKPAQPELTFPAAFDADAAFLAVEKQYIVVDAAKAEWDDLKEQASEAKKTWERAVDTLGKLIHLHADRKHGIERQPFLKEVGESVSCEVSKQMGAPCPACASQRAKGGDADVNDPLHPAHPEHAALAKSLLVKDARDLSSNLERKGFWMEAAALMLLPVDQLNTLQRYAVQKGAMPPELLMKAHIAAAAGDERQECKHCSQTLATPTAMPASETSWSYPTNAAVGLDCEGRVGEAPSGDSAPAADSQEPKAESSEAARAPKSHATKNRKKKAAPEDERAAQASEGKKRSKKESKTAKAKK